jgi:hypothetical protein
MRYLHRQSVIHQYEENGVPVILNLRPWIREASPPGEGHQQLHCRERARPVRPWLDMAIRSAPARWAMLKLCR